MAITIDIAEVLNNPFTFMFALLIGALLLLACYLVYIKLCLAITFKLIHINLDRVDGKVDKELLTVFITIMMTILFVTCVATSLSKFLPGIIK